MKKKIVLTVVALSIVAATAMAASGKIGYVDTQIVFEKTKLGQKYQGIVREYYESRKKILDEDAGDIQKLQEDYKKQASVMNEKARKEKEENINSKISDFEKKRSEFNAEIAKKNDELSKEFDQALMAVLKEIAKKEKFDIVLNKTINVGPKTDVPAVLFADESLNLTDKVISEMDKKSDTKN